MVLFFETTAVNVV